MRKCDADKKQRSKNGHWTTTNSDATKIKSKEKRTLYNIETTIMTTDESSSNKKMKHTTNRNNNNDNSNTIHQKDVDRIKDKFQTKKQEMEKKLSANMSDYIISK